MRNALLISLCFIITMGSGKGTADEIKVPGQHKTIQAAIDLAKAGDIVTVSAGTYFEHLQLKPGVVLRSEGSDEKGQLGLKRSEVTIIDGSRGSDGTPGVTMAEGCLLDGFTVTNFGNYDEKVWQKNWDENGNQQSYDHIGEFGTPGIAITGVDCRVINNLVHHVGNTGIAIRGVEAKRCSPIIAANICYRNMGGGIGSLNGSSALIQDNICFENFYAGIGHDNASPIVTGNRCYRNIRAGIGISEGACPVIRNNRCYQNQRAGIGIRTGSSTRPVVEDNDCYENAMAGIGCDSEAAAIIRGNRCYQNQLTGIGCRKDASPLIIENHCTENKAAGIGLNAATALLIRNHVEKNEAAGIGISENSKAIMIENTINENRLVAVGIPGGSEAVLIGNTLRRDSGMPPIVAVLNGSNATLIENEIHGGGIAAVMLSGKLYAIGNQLTGKNGAFGVLAKEGSEAILQGNEITGYRTPAGNQGAKSVTLDGEAISD